MSVLNTHAPIKTKILRANNHDKSSSESYNDKIEAEKYLSEKSKYY